MGDMGGMRRVEFSLHAALTQWQSGPFALSALAVLVAVAYWYLRADWILSARGRRWPRHRTVAFLAGLAAVDLALQSPVATFTGAYFQAHIIQHLLLMVVAPPLLALGAPSTLLLQTRQPSNQDAMVADVEVPGCGRAHPSDCGWSLYFGIMFAFFSAR